MKTTATNRIALTMLVCLISFAAPKAQLINKLKKKVENGISKPAGEKNETETADGNTATAGGQTANNRNEHPVPATADGTTSNNDPEFIPGSTVLYFDNFEKDKIGDNPAGWLTTKSAEVVTLDGLKGKWLKMASVSSTHITRNKKQSWSNSFTVEFDILIVKKDYDPRIDFSLVNTGGSLVTDEMILRSGKQIVYVSTILGNGGKATRVGLAGNNNIYKSLIDRMSDQLPYSNTVPVHVSMCVQGKRFRFWWDNSKIFDMEMVDQQYMPNQLAFNFGSVGGSEFYVTNIRVAKDIPATKPATTTPDKSTVEPVKEPEETRPAATSNAATSVKLQSKILTIDLPFAQIMKTGDYTYTFIATREEGNNKENYIKLFLETGNTSLKAETFNFREINQKNPLYGTKKYPEIKSTEAVLYYGAAKKPYIYKFSPIIANAPMASFVTASLERKLPPPSALTKLVIEKVENGMASGYFTLGIMIQGLKPVTKGDAMTETFTDGFSGEMKCSFSNVPVY